jgi:hypothetical protein
LRVYSNAVHQSKPLVDVEGGEWGHSSVRDIRGPNKFHVLRWIKVGMNVKYHATLPFEEEIGNATCGKRGGRVTEPFYSFAG